MALADITIADGQSSPVNHTFAYTGTVSGNRVVRQELAAPVEQPIILSIAHQKVRRNGIGITQHLYRIDRTVLDSDNITGFLNNIRLAADISDKVLSDALADDFAAFIRNWATSANIRAWLRGSVF